MARLLGPLFAEYIRAGGPAVATVLADALLEAGREPVVDHADPLVRVIHAFDRVMAAERVPLACAAIERVLERHAHKYGRAGELRDLLARAAEPGRGPLAAADDRKRVFKLWRASVDEPPVARIIYAAWMVYREMPHLGLNGVLQIAREDDDLGGMVEALARMLERCA